MNKFRRQLLLYIIIFILHPSFSHGNPSQQGIIFNNNLLQINGKNTIVICFNFHYYDCPSELWEQQLIIIRQAGINTILSDIPWNYHEPVENQVDMRELDAFLDLCCRMGFFVIVKPGINSDSENTVEDLPAWLNNKGVRTRSNDPDYMYNVRHWYEHLAPIIRQHQINNGGSVILIQIQDNYFSDSAYKEGILLQTSKTLKTLGLEAPVVTSIFMDETDNNINPSNDALLSNFNRYKRPMSILKDIENNKNTIIFEYSGMLPINGAIGENYFPDKLETQWLHEFGIQSTQAIPQPYTAHIIETKRTDFRKEITLWKFKKLSSMDWQSSWIKSTTVADDWETITIGNNYEHSIISFDGYAGYHTIVDMPPEIINKDLYLNFYGAGDNVFIFINGILAGKHFRGSDEFTIECKNIFHPGSNVITVITEIIPQNSNNNAQPRGIYKSIVLASEKTAPHPVEISEQVYNQSAFIYLFNTSTTPQLFKFEYTDPASKKAILVPQRGYYRLKPKELQTVTCNISSGITSICYSTSQILGTGKFDNHNIVVLYGQEDQPGEMLLRYEDTLAVTGTSNYEVDQKDKCAAIYYDHRDIPYSFVVNNTLFLIENTKNAGTTWLISDSNGIFPLVLSGSLLQNFAYAPSEWKYEIFSRSGENNNSFIAPSAPKSILLDGTEVPFNYDSTTKLVSFNYHSPAPLLESIVLQNAKKVGIIDSGVVFHFQFTLKKSFTENILWKLNLQTEGDGLIYLNDYLVGPYNNKNVQPEFHLPDSWINWNKENIIAIVAKNLKTESIFFSASISPYPESIQLYHTVFVIW